jgi:hypothetical protein
MQALQCAQHEDDHDADSPPFCELKLSDGEYRYGKDRDIEKKVRHFVSEEHALRRLALGDEHDARPHRVDGAALKDDDEEDNDEP